MAATAFGNEPAERPKMPSGSSATYIRNEKKSPLEAAPFCPGKTVFLFFFFSFFFYTYHLLAKISLIFPIRKLLAEVHEDFFATFFKIQKKN